jgi:hypothetical protein
MKKTLYAITLALVLFSVDGCKKESEEKPVIEVEIVNVGFTFWKVVSVKNASDFAITETNNTPFTFEKGRRYKVISMANVAVHPFEFRNAANEVMLSQNIANAGSLKNDASLAFEMDANSISFTVSNSFSTNVVTYNCANHNGMKGMVGYK